jgi:hypothetical protein
MAFKAAQICKHGKLDRSGKYSKKMRNRKIRRVKQTEIPNIKYDGWDD